MIIDIEKENIFVKSKSTGITYQVYKIKVDGRKIKEYLIENIPQYRPSRLEWWSATHFEDMYRISSCSCCCCKCICSKIKID